MKNKSKSVCTEPSERTSIYVADLGDYNEGYLTGDWIVIDNNTTIEDVYTAIKKILANGISEDSLHEDWAIHDYDNIPLNSEHPELELVLKVANLVREYSFEEVSAFIKHFDESQIDEFESRLLGIYSSEQDYITEVNDFSNVSDGLLQYIDYKKMFKDYEYGGEIVRENVSGGDFILFCNY